MRLEEEEKHEEEEENNEIRTRHKLHSPVSSHVFRQKRRPPNILASFKTLT